MTQGVLINHNVAGVLFSTHHEGDARRVVEECRQEHDGHHGADQSPVHGARATQHIVHDELQAWQTGMQ